MSLKLHPRVKKELDRKQAPIIAARKKAEEAKRAARAARKAEAARPLAERVYQYTQEIERILEMTRRAVKDTADLPKCGYHCRNPDPWKEEYCSNKIWAPHSMKRCYDHAWNDPAVRWPKCSRGKDDPNHKPGVHPGVCPKEPTSGLCYFCIRADECEYTQALLEGKPAQVPAWWTDREDQDDDCDQRTECTALPGDYLEMVHMAILNIGLEPDEFSRESLDRAYTCIRKAQAEDGKSRAYLIASCAFLHDYLVTCGV